MSDSRPVLSIGYRSNLHAEGVMRVVYERCCGIDVHKRNVVACLITPGKRGQPQKQMRTFSTMMAELLEMSDGLRAAGCTHVAMESTGVYWKPRAIASL